MKKIRVMTVIAAALIVLCGPGCGQDGSGQQSAKLETVFCEEHQIAEAQCPFCDPSLIESLGFCTGHGVPEAFCYQCNPALIPAFKAVGDWCAEHERPKSQCYICHPGKDPGRAEKQGTGISDHTSLPGGSSTTTAPPGGSISRTQQPPSVLCSTQSLIVRFDSPEIAEQAGLEFMRVESRPITKTIECNAEVAYDGDRYARISAQVPGIVADVHRDFGDSVRSGDPLVTITSTDLGEAKANYLQAVAAVALWEKNLAREKDLLERGVSTERDLLEAERYLAESRAELSEAEQMLLSYGHSEEQIEAVRRSGDTGARYVVTAPFPGIVVDRQVAIGEVVESSRPLFSVADVARMWAFIDVYESDMRNIRVGQPVVLRAEGLPGESFAGYITWLSSELNPRTRTLRTRVELDNRRGLLRCHMFAQASISVRDSQQSLVVPQAAVQWEGCCNVVFVKSSETVYKPRKVHLGVATGTVYEVLSGIEEGEEVVTQGSFLLKTEILKGSIGAGCCEVDPGA